MDMPEIYLEARRLRTTGQYGKSLSVLSECLSIPLLSKSSQMTAILLESATCHLLMHQFRALLKDAQDFQLLNLDPRSKEACLMRLLYETARVHTDIALLDAWESAKDAGFWHLAGKEASDFDTLEVQMLSVYSAIESLAVQMLDVETPDFSPTEEFLESLRLHLLSSGRIDDLVTLHVYQTHMSYRIPSTKAIEEALAAVPTDDVDLQVHLSVMLAHALKRKGDSALAYQLLEDLLARPFAKIEDQRHLFARFLHLSLSEHLNGENRFQATRLLGAFSDVGDYHSYLLLACWLAEQETQKTSTDIYVNSVKELLENRYFLPRRHTDFTSSHGRIIGAPTCSAYLFWQWYFGYINKDMKRQGCRNLATACCLRFMNEMQQCQLPEMQYTLMTVIAEYYDDIGDGNRVLHWRLKANETAQNVHDDDIKYEAECALKVALADDTIHVLDDPHGVKQTEWRRAKMKDLQYLFHESERRSDWQRCFIYAWRLLEKELDEEVRLGQSPRGELWRPQVQKSLQHLHNGKRRYDEPRVAFTVAHAKFEAGEFDESISMLAEVAEKCLDVGNMETASRAFFTTSRAYVGLFKVSKNAKDWTGAEAALITCQTLSEEQGRPDMVACCHVLRAMAWHERKDDNADALTNALESIARAQNIWSTERLNIASDSEVNTLLTHYYMTGRNAKSPYSVHGLAVEICFELGRVKEAFQWAECGKAQAFRDSLQSIDLPGNAETLDEPGDVALMCTTSEDAVLLVHWVFNGETTYMCTCREGRDYRTFKLDIVASVVDEWNQNLVSTKDNLSDAESAFEMLSELKPLCQPLLDVEVARLGDVLLLCPTKVLFKIPLHAIPLGDGTTLLDRHPVVYAHAFSVLGRCISRGRHRQENSQKRITVIGNATGDTPAGQSSAQQIATHLSTDPFTQQQATKEEFLRCAPQSQLVHIHGHVLLDAYPLDQCMLFHHRVPLTAREVFNLDLASPHPTVVLISCGSGIERMDAGDEPLGLISSFLHAGASAVVATMWPIHDRLAGAAFSEAFYGLDGQEALLWTAGETINLARRLQRAALSIKANEATRAPYFWAAFVLHGDWNMRLH